MAEVTRMAPLPAPPPEPEFVALLSKQELTYIVGVLGKFNSRTITCGQVTELHAELADALDNELAASRIGDAALQWAREYNGDFGV